MFIMKKSIMFAFLITASCLLTSLRSTAASIVLYSAPSGFPAGITASIDDYNQVTISGLSGYSASIQRVDFIRHSPWDFWSMAISYPVFSAQYADEIAIQFYIPGSYPSTMVARYYIYY